MSTDIFFEPLIPIWLIVALVLPMLALLAVAGGNRVRGSVLRALGLILLAVALLNPRFIREEHQLRPDRVVIVRDQSASQAIGQRSQAMDAAFSRLTEALKGMDKVDVQVIDASMEGAEETRLFDALERNVAEGGVERTAAVFLITDGQVHDVPEGASLARLGAPIHTLLTGQRQEIDRRVIIEQAPAYGLVNDQVDIIYRVEDLGSQSQQPAKVGVSIDGSESVQSEVRIGIAQTLSLTLSHPGPTVVEIEAAAVASEISAANNRASIVVNGVRDRLRVLLISGQPHPGERTWRNLLKSDPAVDLVHFTILRPPEKDDATPLRELSLIVFPVQELFENKLAEFDLIVFDRYVVRGILPTAYYERLADYVRRGGALLVAVGPEFAGAQSLFSTPLGEVLPVAPRKSVIERAFRPEVTAIGNRHPVTAGLMPRTLPGGERANKDALPAWGQWFRMIAGDAHAGTVLMSGPDGQPLLVADRVGDGRVAQLMSDQVWLWARGFDGGGPYAELLRRLAHWLMKEPQLEEEHLQAQIVNGRLRVERRSLQGGGAEVTVINPAGLHQPLTLVPVDSGLPTASGEMAADMSGLWRVTDGERTAFAASGRGDSREFADLRATEDLLTPVAKATGGGVVWLQDGIPQLRWVTPGRNASGRDWLGLQRRNAFTVTGVAEFSLLPPLLLLGAILGVLVGAWWREGR